MGQPLYIGVHEQRRDAIIADSPRPRSARVIVRQDGPPFAIVGGLEELGIVTLHLVQ